MSESREGLECYVIQMDFKALKGLEGVFKPVFFKRFKGEDIDNGPTERGDITQAYRFSTAGEAVLTVRRLLNNPSVCNDTLDSYEISIRKLVCGVAMSARLSDDGRVSLFE
jgi:hypothetical protein